LRYEGRIGEGNIIHREELYRFTIEDRAIEKLVGEYRGSRISIADLQVRKPCIKAKRVRELLTLQTCQPYFF